MAEGRDGGSYLSPLEEQYIREAEEEVGDVDAQLQREKEVAAQKLWCAFQDSATAVAHLFRDCQQQAGLSAWVPFHESASAVTQLYKGSIDVCRQCMECGVRHGQRKRTRDIVTWLKKKRRLIRRDELLAFLLDKPYPSDSYPSCDRSEDLAEHQPSFSHFPPHHHTYPRPLQPPPLMAGLNYTPPMPVSLPVSSASCFSGPLPNPRGRWALFGREDQSLHSDSELYATRENGRKRLNCSPAGPFEFSQESPPVAKRMKI